MKKVLFFASFFCIILAAKAICYEGNLKFGDELCLSNGAKQIPFAELFDGKLCKEVACMPFLENSKAYICFRQKIREIKFIIAINAIKKTSYDIPVFKDNSTYMLERMAMSGDDPYNAHVTLRLVSDDEAYRLAFNVNELAVQNDDVKLQHLGHESEVYWLPMIDSDRYVIINPNDKALTKISDLPHNNTRQNSPTFDDDPPSYKYTDDPKNCLKWSEATLKTTKLTTVQFPTTTTISIASALKITEKGYFTACVAVGVIIFLCCCIGIPVFCRVNRKNGAKSGTQTAENDVNTNLIHPEHPQSHIQRALQTISSELSLPVPPPGSSLSIVEHHESLPVQLPQSLTPPPSYRTNESVVAGQIVENWITNIFHRLMNSQNSVSNIQRPREEIEMNDTQSQNDLAFL